MKRIEYHFQVIEVGKKFQWRCLTGNGELRGESPLYLRKPNALYAAKRWVKHMLPGKAVCIDLTKSDDLRKKHGNTGARFTCERKPRIGRIK